MSGFLKGFWAKAPVATGVNIKASINAKSVLSNLRNDPAYNNLRALVNTYENIDPANDQDCSQRMTALKNLDAAIFTWFNNAPNDSIAGSKGGKSMLKLMKKAESAHEALVDATQDDPNVVPFDKTGLGGVEIAKRTQIWRDIVDGTGHIELGGSDVFKKRTRAQIGKLLQTQTGTDILDYLGHPPNPAGPTDRLVMVDQMPPDLLQNQRIAQNNPNCSFALELSDTDSDKSMKSSPATGNEDPNEFPALTNPGDLKQAIMDRKKGVIYNGQKYTFSKGSGSVVKTVPPSKNSEDSNTTGVNNKEVVTPPFLTLGHELGHAVNIRSGAAARDHSALMIAFVKANDPNMTDQDVETRWTNSEEFFNITNFEDGLRGECGIGVRDAHKTRSGLASLQNIQVVRLRHQDLVAKDLVMSSIPQVDSLSQEISANANKLDDEKAWSKIEKGVIRAEKVLTDDYVEKFKKKDLMTRFGTLHDVYNDKSGNLDDTQAEAVEYGNIKDELEQHMDTWVAIGTTTYNTMRDRIRTNRLNLEKL